MYVSLTHFGTTLSLFRPSNTLSSVDWWTEEHHILGGNKEQIYTVYFWHSEHKPYTEDRDRILTRGDSRVCFHWLDCVNIRGRATSSDEDEEDDNDDDGGHDGIGLENSVLQDLWPKTVV